MSKSNYYSDSHHGINENNVYEIVDEIEMQLFNEAQSARSSVQTNAVYIRAPILEQKEDYVYMQRENINRKYARIERVGQVSLNIFTLYISFHLDLPKAKGQK
jgi:hypothetical protein